MKLINLPLLAMFASTLATPTLNRRDDGVSCKGTAYTTENAWTVVVNKDREYDPNNRGGGFLDNLRGRCGVITGWGCDTGANDSANMHFNTTIFCTAYDVTQAINAATSKKVNLGCSLT